MTYTVQLKQPGGAWEGDDLIRLGREIIDYYEDIGAASISDVDWILYHETHQELSADAVQNFQKSMEARFNPNPYAFDEPRGAAPAGGWDE